MVRVLIKSYGCSASVSDGEIMAGLLRKAGHKLTVSENLADVIIVNTCIVKGRTEARMRSIISKLAAKFPKKRIIVAGCLPQAGIKLPVKGLSVVGPHNLTDIVAVVEGKKKRAVGRWALVKAGMPKKPGSSCVEIVQILEGCSGACAYCIVKQAKPVLRSFSERLIVTDVKSGLARGAKEVWLTSQDNASYMLDKNKRSGLPGLLRKIDKIPGKFLVRVGMMNPDTILPVLGELIEAYKSPKVFKFLHIPVQSGNDRILKLMNRKYNVATFKRIVERFREEIPGISISTDIIVGFPGESESEFQESMRLLKWLRPDVLNLSRFVARPRTAAESMKGQVHGSITKERSERMSELFYRMLEEKNKEWKGWKGEIYVDERGKDDSFMGRNIFYKPIVVKTSKNLLGRFVDVEVVEGRRVYLEGRKLKH